jgi:hypothetical protein
MTHSNTYSGEVGDDIYKHVSGYPESIHIAPYDRPLPTSLFAISDTHPHTNTKPFRQRIQLCGPSRCPVRATAQVDDGAMRNCIGLHIWNSYGHCLGTLTPTTLRVSVANNQSIVCAGLWSGEVNIGGTKSYTHFVVFDCGKAFDVILGKPWLREVDAIHHYKTDTITIGPDSSSTTINNVEHTTVTNPAPTSSITPTDQLHQTRTKNTNTLTEPSMDDLLEAEALRIKTLHHTQNPFSESRWAKYLDIEDMEDEDPTPENPIKAVEWFTTRAEQRAIARAKQMERKADRKRRNREVLDWLTHEADKNAAIDRTYSKVEPLPRAEVRRQSDLHDSKRWQDRRAMVALIKNLPTATDPLEMAETHDLLESEQRITKLKSKLEYLRQMAQVQPVQTDEPSIHTANTVTEQEFTIDRGDNNSPRITDPFAEERVNEILQKIAIGPDLTNDQRDEIQALIRDYADVFALSLSEVRVVDWYKHHLNIDPSIKLPKKTAQRPVTEAQKDWFFSILDEMEDAHVVQRVPGDFIKALSSTNVQLKEAGKIGATRTEILRKVNAECIKNGLPPFWEEVREPGETDEAMLEAVESQNGTEIKTKWRLCHAFTALNKATQIPSFPQGNLKAKQEFAAGHRWASVIDFSAGYYAVPLDDESVPYVAFQEW